MAKCPTSRWFLWLSCVLAAFFCARTAGASAPMCDVRGMSIDAPPPVMPIRDARIERASAPICTDEPAMVGAGRQVRRNAAAVDSGGCIDGWMKTHDFSFPELAVSFARRSYAAGLAQASGHDGGVFRPPCRLPV